MKNIGMNGYISLSGKVKNRNWLRIKKGNTTLELCADEYTQL